MTKSDAMVGDAKTAEGWIISSALEAETKTLLLRFVHRFPNLQFFRQDAEMLNAVEEKKNVKLPEWLRTLRQTFAFVQPEVWTMLRFDAFDGASGHADSLPDIWYTLGLRGPNNDEQRSVIDKNHLFSIGEWLDTGYSTLAINLANPEDLRIYDYDQEEIVIEKGLPSNRIGIVFNSYASMLSHIVAIKLPGEDNEILAETKH